MCVSRGGGWLDPSALVYASTGRRLLLVRITELVSHGLLRKQEGELCAR